MAQAQTTEQKLGALSERMENFSELFALTRESLSSIVSMLEQTLKGEREIRDMMAAFTNMIATAARTQEYQGQKLEEIERALERTEKKTDRALESLHTTVASLERIEKGLSPRK